jgi:hypothetical protein
VPSSSYTPQLRPLSIGEVLDAGFRLLRHRFGTLMLCVLAIGVPVCVLRTIVIASTSPDFYDVDAIQFGDPTTEQIVGYLAAVALFFLGAMLAVAACFRVISAAYLGQPVKAGRSLAAGARRMPAMVIAALALGIVYFVAAFVVGMIAYATGRAVLLILIPMGIHLTVKSSLVWPAIVAEKAGPFRAINRSWRLTDGNWWRCFAVLLVTALITLILYFAFDYGSNQALGTLDSISEVALATVDTVYWIVVLALLYPVAAAVLAVLYYDTRVRKEGFDLELLAQSIGGASASRFERSPERPEAVPAPAATPVAAASPSGGFAPPEGPPSAS